MPIYEFYCRDCHTIYSFFSRRVDTETIPACPKAQGKRHRLQRQVSRFAISRGLAEPSGDHLDLDIDDEKMEKAMMQLAAEMDGADEDDPRTMARVMRRLSETTGLPLGSGMEEAIRRMEAGEDPDKIEEELGDVLESEEPFATGESKLRGVVRRMKETPNVDPQLYDL
ncbi:MAG: cytochrome c [Pirellulaceae bacterium]|nr:MAG: cytochrome c [Pirellulaceae bacterium]